MRSADVTILLWLLIFIVYLILWKTENPVKHWLKKYRSITNIIIGVIVLVQFYGHNVFMQIPILFILIGLFYLYKDYKNIFGSNKSK